MESPLAQVWEDSSMKELKSLKDDYDVYDMVDRSSLPSNAKVIPSMFVYTIKRNSDGEIEDHKARLVAIGNNQREGVDFHETFAPTLQAPAMRSIFALAAQEDLIVEQTDINKAYLHGELDVDHLYMLIPDGLAQRHPELKGKILHLKKALYGLPQAGNIWNKTYDAIIRNNLGYTPIVSDGCVYVKSELVKGRRVYHILAIYVDDNIHVSASQKEIDRQKKILDVKLGIKQRGEPKFLLGIQFRRGKDGSWHLSQGKYIREIVHKFIGDEPNRATYTPFHPGILASLPDVDENCTPERRKAYLSIIGSLLYVSGGTRPEITFHINFLARFSKGPTGAHFDAARHILRYLRSTPDLGLHYRKDRTGGDATGYFQTNKATVEELKSGVVGFTDAGWADDSRTRRSTMAYVFLQGGAATSWASKQTKAPSLSSCESELNALTEGAREAKLLKKLKSELGHPHDGPITIFGDNTGANSAALNTKNSARQKHMEIKDLWIRQAVREKIVSIEYIATQDQVADALTKPLPRPAFERHRKSLGIVNPPVGLRGGIEQEL